MDIITYSVDCGVKGRDLFRIYNVRKYRPLSSIFLAIISLIPFFFGLKWSIKFPFTIFYHLLLLPAREKGFSGECNVCNLCRLKGEVLIDLLTREFVSEEDYGTVLKAESSIPWVLIV